jgi:hypothetical protein
MIKYRIWWMVHGVLTIFRGDLGGGVSDLCRMIWGPDPFPGQHTGASRQDH